MVSFERRPHDPTRVALKDPLIMELAKRLLDLTIEYQNAHSAQDYSDLPGTAPGRSMDEIATDFAIALSAFVASQK